MIAALMSRPIVAAVLIALATGLLGLFAYSALDFEGDVARALKGRSEAFLAHKDLEETFGAPSRDEVYLVRSDDFGADDNFVALEDLVIDLQLTAGVRAVLSIFALPDPDGSGLSFLSRRDIQGLAPAERITRLRAGPPLAGHLISEDRSAALLVIIPDLSMPNQLLLANLGETMSQAAPGLSIKPVGLAALQREISIALLDDQILIAPTAVLVCIILALVLFRSWRAAIVCALPSVVGLTWTFAAMPLMGYPMDPLMAVVPTVLIVLGIADSVHVFHAVRLHFTDGDLHAAIARGLRETMPAVILASVTTALAFLSLIIAGSPTVANIAVVGPVGLALTTLAVFLVLPPAMLLLLRNKGNHGVRPVEFRAVVGRAVRLLGRRRAVAMTALGAMVTLFAIQTQTVAGYRLMDHVPRNGTFRANLQELERVLPGSDQGFVLLKAADPAAGLQPADRALIDRASAVLYGADSGIVPSGDIDGREHALVERFFGNNGEAFALPLIGPLASTRTQVLAAAEETRRKLTAAGITDFRITGHSLMASTELPLIVQELRFAFYIAVGLVTVLAALLMRSIRLAAMSLVPNLIPIFGVETWLVLTDQPLTAIGAIALTVAFGIAVDDTIHLLNRIRIARGKDGTLDRTTIETALRATAAPVIATSIVLLAGFSVTAFSILPSVSQFGQLTGAAMVLALFADLFLFPGLLLWGSRQSCER